MSVLLGQGDGQSEDSPWLCIKGNGFEGEVGGEGRRVRLGLEIMYDLLSTLLSGHGL